VVKIQDLSEKYSTVDQKNETRSGVFHFFYYLRNKTLQLPHTKPYDPVIPWSMSGKGFSQMLSTLPSCCAWCRSGCLSVSICL